MPKVKYTGNINSSEQTAAVTLSGRPNLERGGPAGYLTSEEYDRLKNSLLLEVVDNDTHWDPKKANELLNDDKASSATPTAEEAVQPPAGGVQVGTPSSGGVEAQPEKTGVTNPAGSSSSGGGNGGKGSGGGK